MSEPVELEFSGDDAERFIADMFGNFPAEDGMMSYECQCGETWEWGPCDVVEVAVAVHAEFCLAGCRSSGRTGTTETTGPL